MVPATSVCSTFSHCRLCPTLSSSVMHSFAADETVATEENFLWRHPLPHCSCGLGGQLVVSRLLHRILLFIDRFAVEFHAPIHTGRSNWILYRKLKYERCLRLGSVTSGLRESGWNLLFSALCRRWERNISPNPASKIPALEMSY